MRLLLVAVGGKDIVKLEPPGATGHLKACDGVTAASRRPIAKDMFSTQDLNDRHKA